MWLMDNSGAFGGIRDGAKSCLVMPKSSVFYQTVSLIYEFGAGQVGFVNQNQGIFDQSSLG